MTASKDYPLVSHFYNIHISLIILSIFIRPFYSLPESKEI